MQRRVVTAAALLRASRARGPLVRALVAAACVCSAAPAAAEVGASVSIYSQSRYRGYSLSAGRPVAVLDLSYDDPSGLYGALSGSAVLNAEDEVRAFGLVLNGGYAKRLSSGLTLDFGAIHSSYSPYSRKGEASSFTEIYAGVTRKFLSARVSFSPHYFEAGARTFYGELDANVSPLHRLNLEGHVGLLVPVAYRYEINRLRTQYDWRVGAAQEFGRASLHIDLSGGGPSKDRYRGRFHSRTALTFGLSYAL